MSQPNHETVLDIKIGIQKLLDGKPLNEALCAFQFVLADLVTLNGWSEADAQEMTEGVSQGVQNLVRSRLQARKVAH